ncbi:MAG: n-acetylglutamate synthase [Bacteroidota bacterium]
MVDYDGRRFRAAENSAGGEAGEATVFEYHQEGCVVWATYRGGRVAFGSLVATADAEGRLDMRYQHVNMAGRLMTGSCETTPEVLPDGRLRLHERWRWTSGDRSEGTSTLEETR